MNRSKSEELFALAQNRIPGGVDSPVRAFRGVGGTPFFVEKGEGDRIRDADGKAYLVVDSPTPGDARVFVTVGGVDGKTYRGRDMRVVWF